MKRTRKRQLLVLLFTVAVLMMSFPVTADTVKAVDVQLTGGEVVLDTAEPYSTYIQTYGSVQQASDTIRLAGAAFDEADENTCVQEDYHHAGEPVAITSENGYITWRFTVKNEGRYSLLLDYCPFKGKGSAMVRSLYIDGKIPFDEARNFTFSRAWSDATPDGVFDTDRDGNDVRPMQTESPGWMHTFLYASTGLVETPLEFYFSAGEHTLTLKAVQEPMAIRSLTFCRYNAPISAQELRKQYADAGYTVPKTEGIRLQAEHPTLKSDSVLMPVSDRSSPATEPNDPSQYKLNTLGSIGWDSYGSWVTYSFTVKESGLYQIALKTRQNFVVGSSSFRTVLVDDMLLCQELSAVEFPYGRKWTMSLLQDEQGALPIYLEAGQHTLTLKNTLGNMTEILLESTELLKELNTIYTNILMLVGSNPDVNRDYQFVEVIPETLEQMAAASKRLKELYERLVDAADTMGENTQTLVQLHTQIEAMVENPNRIAEKFVSLRNYIESFGAWIDDSKSQNLDMDYIEVAPLGSALPKVSASFGDYIAYHFRSFVSSFVVDYNNMSYGESGAENITVWVGSGNTGGRDQAQILRTMVSDTFTPKHDVGVTVKLVSMGALLPATLAGIGPDVALSLGSGEAANYAFRNALVDIGQMAGFDEVAGRFAESAMAPLRFGDMVYGIPETQSFLVMFYRKDILLDLGITRLPSTWDEVQEILPILHKNQMGFALPNASLSIINMYATLLFQNGGRLYTEDGVRACVDEDVSVDVFSYLTSLYAEHGLSEALNFLNRFRQGTAPIGIEDYTLYNSLSVFAPELKGLWDFTTIPGTPDEQGQVNNASVGGVTASVILRTSQYPEASWEFIKWWTDTDAQVLFGKQLESIMGSAARYATANMEAVYQMTWTDSEYRTLLKQWESVEGIPEVPGGYFMPRYLNFAFRDVVHRGQIPGDTLIEATKNINAEILQKRLEFGLPTQ